MPAATPDAGDVRHVVVRAADKRGGDAGGVATNETVLSALVGVLNVRRRQARGWPSGC